MVNPKLNSNLVPKCQDVAYKFLGIEKPLFIMNFDVKTEMDTELPLELEQVDSPESDDKSMALHPPGVSCIIHRFTQLQETETSSLFCSHDFRLTTITFMRKSMTLNHPHSSQ